MQLHRENQIQNLFDRILEIHPVITTPSTANTTTTESTTSSSSSSTSSSTSLPFLQGFSTILSDEKIYIFGGELASAKYNHQVYVFDVLSQEYRVMDTIGEKKPVGRAFHSAVLVQERYMVIVGGETHDPDWKYLNDVYSLDLQTRQWKCLHEHVDLTFDNVTEIYQHASPFEQSEKDEMPLPRHSHSCTVVVEQQDKQQFLIIFGGYHFSMNMGFYLNDMWKFDMQQRKWHKCIYQQQQPPPPQQSLSHQQQAMDPLTEHVPSGRYSHYAFTIQGGATLCIFGGFFTDHFHYLSNDTIHQSRNNTADRSKLYMIHLNSMTWEKSTSFKGVDTSVPYDLIHHPAKHKVYLFPSIKAPLKSFWNVFECDYTQSVTGMKSDSVQDLTWRCNRIYLCGEPPVGRKARNIYYNDHLDQFYFFTLHATKGSYIHHFHTSTSNSFLSKLYNDMLSMYWKQQQQQQKEKKSGRVRLIQWKSGGEVVGEYHVAEYLLVSRCNKMWHQFLHEKKRREGVVMMDLFLMREDEQQDGLIEIQSDRLSQQSFEYWLQFLYTGIINSFDSSSNSSRVIHDCKEWLRVFHSTNQYDNYIELLEEYATLNSSSSATTTTNNNSTNSNASTTISAASVPLPPAAPTSPLSSSSSIPFSPFGSGSSGSNIFVTKGTKRKHEILNELVVLMKHNQIDLIQDLHELFLNTQKDPVRCMSDICFDVAGRKIYCHAELIKSRCHYLKTLLESGMKETGTAESATVAIELKVAEEEELEQKKDVYVKIFEYLYGNSFENICRVDNCLALYLESRFLGLEDLEKLCRAFIQRNMNQEEMVLDILALYDNNTLDDEKWKRLCLVYLRDECK